jgi:hypothetical protein
MLPSAGAMISYAHCLILTTDYTAQRTVMYRISNGSARNGKQVEDRLIVPLSVAISQVEGGRLR